MNGACPCDLQLVSNCHSFLFFCNCIYYYSFLPPLIWNFSVIHSVYKWFPLTRGLVQLRQSWLSPFLLSFPPRALFFLKQTFQLFFSLLKINQKKNTSFPQNRSDPIQLIFHVQRSSCRGRCCLRLLYLEMLFSTFLLQFPSLTN